MEDIKRLHRIHLWMWEIEKKYPRSPEEEAAWVEIVRSADELVEELDIKHGTYEAMLIADFMHTKERAQNARD